MKSKITITEQEKSLFRDAAKGVKRIKHDSILPQSRKKPLLERRMQTQNPLDTQADSFHFSDMYQPKLPDEGPVCYLSPGLDKYRLKRLRRGDFQPELLLDLHGLTQQQAKRELAALLNECIRTHTRCASVMTGFGKHILQQRVPAWLAQHPAVEAFHQAPKQWGGKSALLILINTGNDRELDEAY